jgi:hypothetical protein
MQFIRRGLPAILWSALVVGICATALNAQSGLFRIVDDFATSPFIGNGGSWAVEGDGLTTGQFVYDATSHALITHVDSRLATTKLVRPLPRSLGGSDSFEFGALLLIDSNGFHASPYAYFEIAFGLTNSHTTGTDRAGVGSGNDDTYDTVEWDFFPNISPLFGGPSVGPTVIGGRAGDAWYENFAFNFGLDTDLRDEIAAGLLPATGLPLDTFLRVRLKYDGQTKMVSLDMRAYQNGAWRTLPVRVPPTDASGLDPAFLVDRMAISLYYDPMNPSAADPSATATVRYFQTYVQSAAGHQGTDADQKAIAPNNGNVIAMPR